MPIFVGSAQVQKMYIGSAEISAAANSGSNVLGPAGSFPGITDSSLYLPLKTSIVPSRGSSTPTFTRATVAWSFDNEGKLNLNVPSGRARFKGGRLVRNLVTGSSENITTGSKSGVTTPNATTVLADAGTASHYMSRASSVSTPVVGHIYSFRVRLQKINHDYIQVSFLSASMGATFYASINLTTGETVVNGTNYFKISAVSSGIWDVEFSGYVTAVAVPGVVFSIVPNMVSSRNPTWTAVGTESFGILRVQIENVSGQTDQTPSEYVSVGVLSSPYHGAGADGCKWFPTNKDGSAISSSTLEGYFAEPQRTNNCLWNRDLTNVAWTNTNITAAKTATGLDNVANSATRLTAAATDATITQLLTAATGTRTLSAYIKRVSGSGTISLTRNGGTNWTDITSSLVTGSWVLVQMTSDVGANPTVGIKMGTSGDVIDVDCVQDENGAWATSPILTTTAAVTRNGDVLSYTSAFDVAQGSALCTVQSDVPVGTSIYMLGSEALGRLMYLATATSRTQGTIYDGTTTKSATGLDLNTGMRKRCSRWGTDLAVCCDGGSLSPSAFDGSIGASGTLFVGCSEGGGTQISGPIREVHIWPTPLTDVQMQQVTR